MTPFMRLTVLTEQLAYDQECLIQLRDIEL